MTAPLDRTAVLGDDTLRGRRFAVAHTEVVDAWLAVLYDEVIADRPGCALVATGGHGRGELTPGSDLDLLLLHDGRLEPDVAQGLWYPIWDTGLKLGHSVRTRAETLQLASGDLATATALLSVRCLAGDTAAVAELGEAARAQ